jgi:hypothetical protein
MAEQSHYQVLGVRPEASQSAIDAAYQRLMRQHETAAALERRRTGLDVVIGEARIDRIEEAYAVLRDPVLRQGYDETLIARGKVEESMDLARTARQNSAEAGAWLSEQRRTEETIIFRIGWAFDFAAVRKSLEDRIPARARHYDPTRSEWQIDTEYEAVLVDLFDNYDSPDHQPAPRMSVPIYQPRPYTPSKQHIREMWEGWPFLIIAGLVVAIVLTLLFPRPDERQISADATATAVALFVLAQQSGPGAFPTPTSTPIPPLPVSIAPNYTSVHLRAGPGTYYPSLAFLVSGETYSVVGRTADGSWMVVVTPERIGWSAAWTLAVEGDISVLPVYTDDSELPTITPTTPESGS